MSNSSINSKIVTVEELELGKVYIDNSLGIRWKAVEKAGNGFVMKNMLPAGVNFLASPETCSMTFCETD